MRRSRATSSADRPIGARPVRYRFIGGKGGTGKTTCAASLAIRSARGGLRTLVLSTDPASSLADALAQPLGARPCAVRGVAGLQAAEVDTGAAFAAWLAPRRATFEQILARGTWLAEPDVARLVRLSVPGIDEIAGLLQIVELGEQARYDHVIVDSAPTGHMLRLLGMPDVLQRLATVLDRLQAKHRTVVGALAGGWTPDAADALVAEMDTQAAWIAELLRDPVRTAVAWVTLPEAMSVEETADALAWLDREGVPVDTLIVNRLTPKGARACSWCDARRQVEARVLAALRQRVGRPSISTVLVPAAAHEPRGVARLLRLARAMEHRAPAAVPAVRRPSRIGILPRHAVRAIAPIITADTRLVFIAGKGGVGKTTCAAAAAIDAARRMPARRVLLLSVDPAHSVGDVLGQAVAHDSSEVHGAPSNLAVRELDALRTFASFRADLAGMLDTLLRTDAAQGGGTDDARVVRDLLELAPPGVDEVTSVLEVIEQVQLNGAARAAHGDDLVVVDMAPTGHALRLVAMPAILHDWVKALMTIVLEHRGVVRLERLAPPLLRLSRGLTRLRTLMADPARARVVVVTRPAAVPRAETVRLIARLSAAGITTPALIVNAIGAGACVLCRRERAAQTRELGALRREVARAARVATRLLIAPAAIPPPHGPRALQAWLRRWRELDRTARQALR